MLFLGFIFALEAAISILNGRFFLYRSNEASIIYALISILPYGATNDQSI